MEALKYLSIAELVDQATAQGERISQIVLRDQAEQMDTEPQVLFRKMRENYHVMQESIQKGADPDIKSTSGLPMSMIHEPETKNPSFTASTKRKNPSPAASWLGPCGGRWL